MASAHTQKALFLFSKANSFTAQVGIDDEVKGRQSAVEFIVYGDGENLLANLRGWQFTTERNVIKKRVFLRMKNVNNIVDMYYSIDGIKWNKIESSLDVSGMHHNVLSGFMSMRIALCSMGEGSATFKNFRYQSIK